MSVPFVDLNAIHVPIMHEIEAAIQGVISSNDFIRSHVVDEFEAQFANYIGVDYAVGCANGTDALELALEVLDLQPDDEVIVPVHSWVSTSSAVVRSGAKVVFADTTSAEYTINPKSILEKITPKTKALIVVHLYGNPCPMEEIMTIVKKHQLFLIEDCAQAHGAEYNGKKVGSFGTLSCFSFYPSKNLGALGDGGAVLTNNKSLAERIKAIAHCGQSTKYVIAYLGRNSRLDAIQAAVLMVKLKYLDEWNASRIELASRYHQLLKDSGCALPAVQNKGKHVYHLYVVKVSDRANTIKQLAANGIGYGIHYPFMLNEVQGHTEPAAFPIADSYKQHLLSLPMYAFIEKKELEALKKLSSIIV